MNSKVVQGERVDCRLQATLGLDRGLGYGDSAATARERAPGGASVSAGP